MKPSEHAFDELKSLYDRVDEAVATMSPACRKDGECCRFSSSGLELFASSLEIHYLLHRAGIPDRPPLEGVCSYLEENSCSARGGRTLGCRLYFCLADGEEGPMGLYEKFHSMIRDLHERYDVKYVYRKMSDHPVFRDEWIS